MALGVVTAAKPYQSILEILKLSKGGQDEPIQFLRDAIS
jgi:hypothetical protein